MVVPKDEVVSSSGFPDTDFAELLPIGDASLTPSPQFKVLVLEHGMRPELWSQFFRLRLRAFGAYEGLSRSATSESDGFDRYSTAILAVQRERVMTQYQEIVIGGCRLIDGRRIMVPLAREFPIMSSRHFEISRMLLHASLEDKVLRDLVLYQICDAIAEYAFGERQYALLVSDMIERFYQRIKFLYCEYLKELGPPRMVRKPGVELELVPVEIRHYDVPAMRERHLTRLQERAARIEKIEAARTRRGHLRSI